MWAGPPSSTRRTHRGPWKALVIVIRGRDGKIVAVVEYQPNEFIPRAGARGRP